VIAALSYDRHLDQHQSGRLTFVRECHAAGWSIMPKSGSALLTDLYQLNMLAAYLDHGLTETAVFELFVRRLPPRRGFLMAAGLEQALRFLEALAFTSENLAAARSLGEFSDSFVGYLRSFRFTGDVDAMPEGTVFFPDEPILRVTAPLPEAQFVETRLVNLLHFQTVIASKAARMVLAASGRPLIDYGLRRAHGAEAGMLAARASYIAGFSGTATVAAGLEFGIPVYGTMAHSFIQAHDDETLAFEHFAHSRPQALVLLIDTYDTERAAGRVVALAPRLAAEGITISGVRIDSGKLGEHAVRVRQILDEGGLQSVKIVASGGLDENALLVLSRAGAPIDSYGVGTSLTTSSDAPALDCAYKLQEYAGIARRKRSEGKATWPGRKQVWRWYDEGGRLARDLVSLAVERYEGEPLLRPAMRGGRRLADLPDLTASRAYAKNQLARLPEPLARLEHYHYPVDIGMPLRELAAALDRRSG
jgi:nicotinate phosphoribosyltransferase